ncbi:MAG: type II secretion system F family protein [Robiginitomaculum sp.]
MEPSIIITIAGVAALMIIGYLILDTDKKPTSKRLNVVAGGTKAKRSIFSFMKVEDGGGRRKFIEDSLDDLEKNKKTRSKKVKSLSSKLIQANWKASSQQFIIISCVIGLLVGGVPLILGLKPLIALGIGFAVGFGLPRFILNFSIARRQKKFTAHFADSMDIIVRGVRTGLPLGDCLKIIAHESPEPIKGEFQRLIETESVGVPLETCIERMYGRMPLSEVNFFGTVLSIQRTTGGNLGESLDNLSKVLRGRKLLREKIKALAQEAKMSAMIIGALPIIVMGLVTMTTPDYMMPLYTEPMGQRNLIIGAVMMILGIIIMRKMINFKF